MKKKRKTLEKNTSKIKCMSNGESMMTNVMQRISSEYKDGAKPKTLTTSLQIKDLKKD